MKMDASTDLFDSGPIKKYKCPENGCSASYSKQCRLEVHKRKHTEERPFVCDVKDCNRAFTQSAHLKRHKSYVHERTNEISCTAQGCGRVFNNKYSLKKHVNQQHSSSALFKCMHCSQEFKKKRQLKRHLYMHGEDTLTCLICNISFKSFHLYNKHKGNHKTYTCDCGIAFNKWTLFCEHRKSCNVKKIDHKCVICNKIFKTLYNWRAHSLSHLEESQVDVYHCPYLDCKRSYKYKKNLNYHVTVFHEKKCDDTRINCTIEGCNVTVKSEKNLKQHIFNMHEGARKKKKDRNPRKDKGKKKKCMAAVLSGVSIPVKEHLAILESCNDSEKLQPNETINNEKFDEEKAEEIVVAAVESSKEESNTSTRENIPGKEAALEQTVIVSLQNFEVPFNERSFLTEACFNDIIILDDK